MTTADDPMLALSHVAIVRYRKARTRALKDAKAAVLTVADADILKDAVRYEEGSSMLHAGQGGSVEAPQYSYEELRSAISRLPITVRHRVVDQLAAAEEEAAHSIRGNAAAREKFLEYSQWWLVAR